MGNSDAEDYGRRVADALAKGEPIPDLPGFSPLGGLAMAQHESVTEWVNAGFSRGEALYMVSSMFCGNPGASPAAGREGD